MKAGKFCSNCCDTDRLGILCTKVPASGLRMMGVFLKLGRLEWLGWFGKNTIAMVFLLAVLPLRAEVPRPPNGELSSPRKVLIIGDSNTEMGHFPNGLARIYEDAYGFYGSGYRSLSFNSYADPMWITGNGREDNQQPWLKISTSAPETWKITFTSGPKAMLSPTTSALTNATADAFISVEFFGRGIELYFLAESTGGTFLAAVDGGDSKTADSTAESPEIRSLRIDDLSLGWHRLKVTAGAGAVTFVGVQSHMEANAGAAPDKKAVVHNWGRSGATSSNFAEVRPEIHASALRLLNPDVVIVLLGTNNHNIASSTAPEFYRGIDVLIDRIREAVPKAKILVSSTLPFGAPASYSLLESYLRQWKVNVEARGASFFDLHGWMGGNPEAASLFVYPEEKIHFSTGGGEEIAAEFFRQIEKLPEQSALMRAPRMDGIAHPLALPQVNWWFAADGPMERDSEGRVKAWLPLNSKNPALEIEAVQPDPSARPLWNQDSVNGLPAVKFDGISSYLRLRPRGTGFRAYAVVFRAANANGPLLTTHITPFRDFGPGTWGTGQMFSEKSKNGDYYLNGRRVADRRSILADPKKWNILIVNCEKHGNAVGIGYGRIKDPDPGMPDDLFFDGEIAELVFQANILLTDDQVIALNSYLASKYGIPLEN